VTATLLLKIIATYVVAFLFTGMSKDACLSRRETALVAAVATVVLLAIWRAW
jgi:hypothetical protein